MQSTDDSALLRKYAEGKADHAFAEIVTRHINLVYSVALRQVGDPHQAEEITQSVFIILAKKAPQLRHEKALSSWLFQATRLTASNFVRGETRRHRREQEAHMQSVFDESGKDLWPGVAPFLDDAVAELSEKDRHAIVLRFYEGRNLREIGEVLGISEDAAEKRVSRAVEKLRNYLLQRGVSASAGGLAVVISAHAVQAAPAGLAMTVSTAALLAGTTVASTTIATATKAIIMTTLQKTTITATLAIAIGTGIYQVHKASILRGQMQNLREQQAPLAAQLIELKTENQRLSNLVAQATNSQTQSQAQFKELLKLRGQANLAQMDSRELAQVKSTLAAQTGKTENFLTNAMAMGLSTAQKFQQKEALARLGRMKKILNLTDDQALAIGNVMTNQIQRQTQRTMDLMTGKLTREQMEAAHAAESGGQDAEIKALLTQEQVVAYPQYLDAEKTTAAESAAKSDSGRIAEDFKLSKEQQEQLQSLFYDMHLKEAAGTLNQQAIVDAKKSGKIEDAGKMGIELMKSQLEEKLKVLESFLSPEQMKTYRQEQTDQINKLATAMKMFYPPKPAERTN